MYELILSVLSRLNNSKKVGTHLSSSFVDKYHDMKDLKQNLVASSKNPNAFSNSGSLFDVEYSGSFDYEGFRNLRNILYSRQSAGIKDEFFEKFDYKILEMSLQVVKHTINLPLAAYSLNVYKDVLRYYDYAQAYFPDLACRSSFKEAQASINNQSYPNLTLSQDKTIFSYIDPDSSKYSIGLIPQKKITLFYGNTIDGDLYNVRTPTTKGFKADIIVDRFKPIPITSTKYEVKNLSLPSFIEKNSDGASMYTVGHGKNSSIIFTDHLNALISSSLAKISPLKNLSEYNLFLNVNAYPDLETLRVYREYQNILNNGILDELRSTLKEHSILIPKTKVYFTFTGLATEDHTSSLLNEVFKFNLSSLKDSASLTDDQILDIIMSLNKKE